MLGCFQTTTLKLQVTASTAEITEHLINPELIRRWAWPQEYPGDLPRFTPGLTFISSVGALFLGHRVEECSAGNLKIVLWGAVDGFSQWAWGDGWLEQTTTGISLLPLALAQRQLLNQLVSFLQVRRLP